MTATLTRNPPLARPLRTVVVPTDTNERPCTASPDLFFPGANEVDKLRQAQQLCAGCPIRISCCQYAFDTKQTSGVWGGRNFALVGLQ
jgi:WhiB family redox-sensing transcriptional regulator